MRVDPTYLSNLTGALNQSSSMISNLTSELSSGLSIQSLQDNPVAVAQSTLLASQIEQADTFVQSATGVGSMMQVADSTLGDVVTQIDKALSLAVEANNGTQNASNNASVAQSLSGILSEVVSLANTSYQGQYLFSGSQGSVQPFTLNTVATPPTATYAGDTNVQTVEVPGGQKLPINLPGSSVFGSGATGIMGALSQLIGDISSGASTASLSTDTAALTTALGQLSDQRQILDSSLSRLNSASTFAQTSESQLLVAQGSLVSANPAVVATQLSSAETQHQALLSVMNTLANQQDLFQLMR
ncbi:flagellar hook-associated protein FlgL [Tunturiibacter gelidoferens]|uniref:Flagellar hook-associated protein 3 FlgL n=1 Tax=Tunturiibacter gelidiferens TaxID=3069689 RepID=A0ACC5NVY5_9BACT|nr:flagellar hook-associated protein FlgL [Edaphobacter lichenicola]MBB5338508.1 flagellar hook-associated protein 3 FlgL [Edaphobacter lichenicola]